MKFRKTNWLIVVIIIAIAIGAFMSYREQITEWSKEEPTNGSVAMMVIYAVMTLNIWRR